MSLRGKSMCLRLAKEIIASNFNVPIHRRLRGGLIERTAACEQMANAIAAIRMAGRGAEWKKSKHLDIVVSDLRKTAGDLRLTAGIRSRAVVSLCVIEGFLPSSELGDGAQSEYIKQLISMPTPQSAKRVEKPHETLAETFDEIVARVRGGTK
jgi:hypothetical protein